MHRGNLECLGWKLPGYWKLPRISKKNSFTLVDRNKYINFDAKKNECFVGVFFVLVKTPGVHCSWIGLLGDVSCNGFIVAKLLVELRLVTSQPHLKIPES